MKRLINFCNIVTVFFVCSALFQSCLKDTTTRTYTLYYPVYKTSDEVRAGIKSGAPMPISKAGKIVVLGNYIFLNEVDKGIHVIDNTNPAAPVNKFFVAIPGNLDLAVKGNTLYADLYKDLVTIDITDPAAITVKKITKNVFPPRQYYRPFIEDTSKVIVDWIKKDTTVNSVEAPLYGGVYMYLNSALVSAPVPAAIGISGSMARFALLNNYLYTVTGFGIKVFNISQAYDPVLATDQSIGWQIETIYPFKGNLFIGSQAGVYIFNTTDPAHPKQLSVFAHLTSCDPVIADDHYAYVTLHDGTACHGTINQLSVLDIADINSPREIKTYNLTNPHGLAKDGNTLFICDGAGGLKVLDASDVNEMNLLQTVGGINALDVIAFNHNAIVVAENGLYQYDYTNNKQVTLRSKLVYGL